MSGISTNIPGTNYQIRGDQFIGQDGTTLTRDQFVDKVSKKEMEEIDLRRDAFHGEWNYTIVPRPRK